MFPSIVMKDINEIVSALLDGTLQESETIELKRTLPHDLQNIAGSPVKPCVYPKIIDNL